MNAVAQQLERIVALRMVTRDPDRLAQFYAEALGAKPGRGVAIGADECRLLGVSGGTRRPLRIGNFAIDLDRFEQPGREYPSDADAADTRFQHVAVIVRDIDAVFERVRAAGATLISCDGPVTLPPSSGGVTAVKLRDPDGHPFELLRFPLESDNAWRNASPNAVGVLGIDHTAISVVDTERARAFYARAGLAVGDVTLNHGPTQEALDGLALVSVDVVPMMPKSPAPHLELLGYHGAGERRVAESATADIVATRTVWASDREALLRDPDGHWYQTLGALSSSACP